jgi:hypothetical protein
MPESTAIEQNRIGDRGATLVAQRARCRFSRANRNRLAPKPACMATAQRGEFDAAWSGRRKRYSIPDAPRRRSEPPAGGVLSWSGVSDALPVLPISTTRGGKARQRRSRNAKLNAVL